MTHSQDSPTGAVAWAGATLKDLTEDGWAPSECPWDRLYGWELHRFPCQAPPSAQLAFLLSILVDKCAFEDIAMFSRSNCRTSSWEKVQFMNKNSEAMTEIGNAQGAIKHGMFFQSLPRTIALTHSSDQTSIGHALQKKHAPLVEWTRNPRENRLNTEVLMSVIKNI